MFQFQDLVKAPVRPDAAGCHASVTQLWAHSEPHHGWPGCHSLGYLRLVTSSQVTVPVLPPSRSPAVTVMMLEDAAAFKLNFAFWLNCESAGQEFGES